MKKKGNGRELIKGHPGKAESRRAAGDLSHLRRQISSRAVCMKLGVFVIREERIKIAVL